MDCPTRNYAIKFSVQPTKIDRKDKHINSKNNFICQFMCKIIMNKTEKKSLDNVQAPKDQIVTLKNFKQQKCSENKFLTKSPYAVEKEEA